MEEKISLLRIFLAIIVVNFIGLVLKYYELDTFIIILGFRFHISLVLPFFFVVNNFKTSDFVKEFSDPDYKKNYPYVIPLIIIPLVLYTGLYTLGFMDLGDPEYFYEFGISSILDLPIYLVWNGVQLLLFFFFLTTAAKGRKISFPIVFIAAVFPFFFEFVTLNPVTFDLIGLVSLLFTGIISATLITRIRNIYWFTIFVFIMLWEFILIFGSNSTLLINLIFASQYTNWEGFFTVQKVLKEYSSVSYLLIIMVVLFMLSLFRKKEKIILEVE